MSFLRRTWTLLDAADVEALASSALDDQLRSMGAHLRPADREDCVQFLLIEAWRLANAYQPERGLSFSSLLYRRSRQRTIDFIRSSAGRTRWRWGDGSTYEREPMWILSLDDPGGNPLGDIVGAGSSDSPEDRVTALDGLHDLGSGAVDRDLETLRRAARRRAAA